MAIRTGARPTRSRLGNKADGTLEETGPEEWLSMRADAVEAPDDWSGSVDISGDDLPGTRKPAVRDWQSELETLDADHTRITEFE